jgi:hypothetical protein
MPITCGPLRGPQVIGMPLGQQRRQSQSIWIWIRVVKVSSSFIWFCRLSPVLKRGLATTTTGPGLGRPAGVPESLPQGVDAAEPRGGGLGLFSQICLGLLEFADHTDKACEGFS